MTQKILCLWCHEERKAQVAFSETSSNGICESCYEEIFANVFREFSWIQKLGFFFRRLFHRQTNLWDQNTSPQTNGIKPLTELILKEAIKRGATKIQFRFGVMSLVEEKSKPDQAFTPQPQKRFSVYFLLGETWEETLWLPIKFFPKMELRLKLMANIPDLSHAPKQGKIFFRHSSPLLEIDDTSIGLVTIEELFLIDFQTPHGQPDKPIIIELTWVPSKFNDTLAAA